MNRPVLRPYADLAEHMVRLRLTAGLTQEQLGRRPGLSRSTVQRAESGTGAPSREVLRTAIGFCNGTEEDQRIAVELRARGRTMQRGGASVRGAPHRLAMRDRPDLQAVLAADFEKSGATLRDFARPVPGGAPIPLGTAWRISRRVALPATAGQLETWMEVCRIHPRDRQIYRDTYARVTTGRAARRVPAPNGVHRALASGEAHWGQDIAESIRPGEPWLLTDQRSRLIRMLKAITFMEAARNGRQVEVSSWPRGGGPDQRFRELDIDLAFHGPDGTLHLFQSKRFGGPESPPPAVRAGRGPGRPPVMPLLSAAIPA